MKKKTILSVPIFLSISWFIAPQIARFWQIQHMEIELLSIIFVGQMYVYTLLPTIWKRIVQSYGTQSIAYIHQATAKTEWVFEREAIRGKRIEVAIEVLDELGQSFHGKSVECFKYEEDVTIEAHQLIVIRYLPFFKPYIVFDPLYYEFPHDRIVAHVIQRKTTSTQTSHSF